jgi:putative addiction module component (TIGR02574 family)
MEGESMSPLKLSEIERQVLRLPARDRERLADRLLKSTADAPRTEVEEAWVREAERRFDAWKKGKRKGIPAAVAFQRLRKGIAR